MAPLVTKFNHNGKRGDVLHIPKPARGLPSKKAANTQVTLVTDTATDITININQWFEYSQLFEDILEIQALPSLRAFYTDAAGYGLARQVDFDLHVLGTGLQGGTLDATPGTPDAPTLTYGSAAVIGSDGSTAWDPTANTNTGNGAALTDAGIRQVIQTLDDKDVPLMNRAFIIPPVEKKNLLGLARFTEQAFTGEYEQGNSIRTGYIGDVYGNPVYVSSAAAETLATDGTTKYRIVLYIHRGAFALVEALGVRSQSSYIQEYLGWLYTADTIYGTGELRDDSGIAIVVKS